MRPVRHITKIRQIIRATLIPFAALCSLSAADAAITFTPGHIYSTYTASIIYGDAVYRNIIEYDANGNVLGSRLIPSLVPGNELRGIAFGPDGLLYAVKMDAANSCGVTVLVLASSGAVQSTYGYTAALFWKHLNGENCGRSTEHLCRCGQSDNPVYDS